MSAHEEARRAPGSALGGKVADPYDADPLKRLNALHHSTNETLSAIAVDAGLTLKQLALGFLLDDPTITSAIIGPRTVPQLEDLLAAGTPTLPAGVRDPIDAVITPGVNLNPKTPAEPKPRPR